MLVLVQVFLIVIRMYEGVKSRFVKLFMSLLVTGTVFAFANILLTSFYTQQTTEALDVILSVLLFLYSAPLNLLYWLYACRH